MGWENVFHCEYDPFCQKVLNHHFPNSKLYEDIKTFDASNYLGRIDILSGGFPCQPFSAAGLRKGTEDDRHLWPEMLRIIREVSPRYVVGENVRGLLNWSGGLVFEQVCADLENEGYEVTPYLLPAAGKNAPHRRDRIWFVAYRNEPSTGTDFRRMSGSSEEIRGRKESFVFGSLCGDGDAPDTDSRGQLRKDGTASMLSGKASLGMLPTPLASEGGKMSGGPTENQMSLSKMARQQTGKTSQLNPLFVEEMMGFPKNWTALPFQSGEKKASKPTVTP
jgi:site-specific DNA-cytosine methylase